MGESVVYTQQWISHNEELDRNKKATLACLVFAHNPSMGPTLPQNWVGYKGYFTEYGILYPRCRICALSSATLKHGPGFEC